MHVTLILNTMWLNFLLIILHNFRKHYQVIKVRNRLLNESFCCSVILSHLHLCKMANEYSNTLLFNNKKRRFRLCTVFSMCRNNLCKRHSVIMKDICTTAGFSTSSPFFYGAISHQFLTTGNTDSCQVSTLWSPVRRCRRGIEAKAMARPLGRASSWIQINSISVQLGDNECCKDRKWFHNRNAHFFSGLMTGCSISENWRNTHTPRRIQEEHIRWWMGSSFVSLSPSGGFCPEQITSSFSRTQTPSHIYLHLHVHTLLGSPTVCIQAYLV